jgi:fructokinase
MKDNGIGTDNVMVYPDRKSPISLAFLNEKNDAEYSFYKDYPSLRLDVEMPEVTSDDIVMFGSFYAITPQLRDKVKELLDKAREAGAIIYYDVNFRSTHANEAIKLMPTILENFEYADIVRGSTEDFGNMFGMTDADKVYQHKVGFYCPRFICTNGGEGLCLRTKTVKKDYPVEPLQTVSTIGAGDNFNAGLVFGLLKNDIRKADLDEMTEADWDKIVASGMSFSREVCASLDNYISKEFAAKL